MLPPLSPIPIKERIDFLFLERGCLDVQDGAFVLLDKNGTRTHIPVGSITCLFLEPGIRITHAATKLAARCGCLAGLGVTGCFTRRGWPWMTRPG